MNEAVDVTKDADKKKCPNDQNLRIRQIRNDQSANTPSHNVTKQNHLLILIIDSSWYLFLASIIKFYCRPNNRSIHPIFF